MKFARHLAVAAIALLLSTPVLAQSNPGLTKGQVPTAAQWNSYFSAKQDVLGYVPLNVAGGTMTGRLVTTAPGATVAGLNLTPGTAPGSPVDGDLWVTSSGFFARVNGTTIGPIVGSTGPVTVNGGPLTVNPTANTTTQGLVVNQTLPLGSAGSGNSYSANLLSIVNNGYQTPPGGATDIFGDLPVVAGVRINYSSAGSGAGQFPIQVGAIVAARATSRGQQLVGLNGTVYTNIDSAGEDAFWGGISLANAGPSSNIKGLWGHDAEVGAETGAVVPIRVGLGASSVGPVTGTTLDAAVAVTACCANVGTAAPWSNALVLWKSDTMAPVSNAIIINSAAFTMQYGFKLDTVTFANKIFDFGASIIQTDGPTGNTVIGGGSSGTGSLTLGVAGSNVGKTLYKNATSGTITVQPPTGALGAVVNSLQAVTDTFVYLSTTDTLSNKTLVSPNFTVSTSLVNNANSATVMSITNTSTGTAATASVSISNNLDQSAFGLAGSNYTSIAQLANRAYVHSGSANNGIILDAAGSKPIDFYINGARVGGFTSGGALTLTTALGVASGGTGITSFGTGVATALGVNVGSAGAFVTFNGAAGTPSSLTLTNATNLPATSLTGTLQAAQEPAHTGDMTNTAGSLATTVTKINGVDQIASWTSYTPTATAQTPGGTPPTFTTVTGAYHQTGKTITARMKAVVNAAGTAAGSLLITLPFASKTEDYTGSAFESAISGKSGGAFIGGAAFPDTANVRARDASGTTFFANGATVTMEITYETP